MLTITLLEIVVLVALPLTTTPLPPPPATPLPSAAPLRSSEAFPVESVPMKLPVSVLPVELLITTPLNVLPAMTRFESVLLFAWSLISMPKVPLPTTRARPPATWSPITSLLKVLPLPLSSRIPPLLKPVISRPLIVLLCESSSSEKPTAPPPAWVPSTWMMGRPV